MNPLNVIIGDKTYTLDVDKAKELGLLVEPYKPKRTGTYFRNTISDALYLLVNVGIPGNEHFVQLTNIATGNYFGMATEVQNIFAITEEEWYQITDDGRGKFEQVQLSITMK